MIKASSGNSALKIAAGVAIEFIDSPRCHRSQISDFCLSVKTLGDGASLGTLHIFPKIKVLRRPIETAGLCCR